MKQQFYILHGNIDVRSKIPMHLSGREYHVIVMQDGFNVFGRIINHRGRAKFPILEMA
jgi:hypothetical protein